ncbi:MULTISPECIES: helix-turn-helix transcriptional regulator [Brevibacillus]|jgi:AraC-type DNA-binding domain-containing proteins|uniref:AraC family transcriptional regulator n=1 Tax=Brevibacillus parabrevis TaxID=54914 RepID=A0A4Y3PQI0_BREPA|nr:MULTISPECIES: helix-turn-helix transcriptional regulator [Brevibacillus]MDH6352627.1 AraC-like DNA-binding protein [Brevibacillus sp. 1238]RNB92120.1 AraC family transcriptional regulator [Brevibacillus parabrevis]WDV95910.1 helix-turn-helix transcriptional regulator [Brevibacillus parabrevis]GEB35624.1 AraC family transcriptional regulator [Brevibacillus parabrevis]
MEKNPDMLPKGVLHAVLGGKKFSLQRYEPSKEIGYFVQHYWVVRWDLRGQAPYSQTVLAHPNVNLVFEQGASGIFGVAPSTSSHMLAGQGHVFGVKFKPGGFFPFWQKPVSELYGTSTTIEEVFQVDTAALEAEILQLPDDQAMVDRFEQFLIERLPQQDPNVEKISQLVARIQADRNVLKVEDAVRLSDMTLRTMQRLFDRYVGVSPKSVIQRYRLHEAAQLIDQGVVSDWLEMSIALGYYDHSHFIRDFRSIVGVSPQQYRQIQSL